MPKATSANDVSRYVAGLLWALVNASEFCVPHTIFLHMYRTLRKRFGKLPYGALITRVFKFKGITILSEFMKERLPSLVVGESTTLKMHLKPTKEGWKTSKDELVKIGDGDDEMVIFVLVDTLGARKEKA